MEMWHGKNDALLWGFRSDALLRGFGNDALLRLTHPTLDFGGSMPWGGVYVGFDFVLASAGFADFG
jgi:hypothetical protein